MESRPESPPTTDAGILTRRALRCQVVHWRFQVLIDAYPERATSTVEDVWVWSLNAEREIREVLGVDSDAYDTMREVRHLMRVVDMQPPRRRRKDYLTDEVFGPIRAQDMDRPVGSSLRRPEGPDDGASSRSSPVDSGGCGAAVR